MDPPDTEIQLGLCRLPPPKGDEIESFRTKAILPKHSTKTFYKNKYPENYRSAFYAWAFDETKEFFL